MIKKIEEFFYIKKEDVENCIASQQARGRLCEKIDAVIGTHINVYEQVSHG